MAAKIRSVGTALEGRLSGLGPCWGDDENGRQFLEQYADPSRRLIRGIAVTGEVLDSTVDGIQTMAEGFQRTEDQNVEAAHSITTAAEPSNTGTTRPSRH
ncbi:hypothetical protein [Streptomyces coerulescens]|uniref:Uncharacterized protein n=1 Tax=Streptomyces coerulescens TaxID=29304 RepID=A0ABW0CUU4_STRCD